MMKKVGVNSISNISNIILILFFFIITVACVYPLLLVLGISFSDENAIMKFGYTMIPKVFSTYAYQYIFRSGESILRAYLLTVIVTIIGMLVSTLIISLYAYPISRKDFKFKRFFSLYVFFTMIFSGGMVPWYIVCVQVLHINNTIFALIMPYLISAWYVIVMRTFFATTIPDSVIESARIDGSGEIKTFFRIVLPLSLPGLATIMLFSTLHYWNDWWLPLMLVNNPDLYNIQFLLYKMINNIDYLNQIASQIDINMQLQKLPSESARMAMCVISIGPIILAYPFFQKYFIRGLTVGSVKG